MIFIVNKNTEQMIVGEPSQPILDNEIWLKDCLVIAIVPGQRGMSPLPHPYPGMFTKNFVKAEALNGKEFKFDRADWLIFNEDEITQETIDIYRAQMAERSGIILSTQIPSNARLING